MGNPEINPEIGKITLNQSEPVLQSMLRAAHLNTLPKLEELYKYYGYQPPAETEAKTPITELSLDWNWADDPDGNAIREARSLGVSAKDYGRAEVDVGGAKLTLERYASSSDMYRDAEPGVLRYKPVLSFTLQTPSGERIADFHLSLDPIQHQWDLNHRMVEERFRHQGVGTQMLRFVEGFVQDQATNSNTSQECTIGARQLEVLLFALRHGYRPRTAADQEHAVALLSGSNKEEYSIITSKGHRDLGTERRPGYIYSRDVLREKIEDARDRTKYEDERQSFEDALQALETGKEVDPSVLESIFFRDPLEYQENALTITFTKTFQPEQRGL